MTATDPTPTCTVRGCRLPLTLAERVARCASGHSFDRAREGHFNLLQPQDRASPIPGDAPDVVAARRRHVDRGLCDPILDALTARLGTGPLVDVGCGEGALIRRLGPDVGAVGVDLSPSAIAAASRRCRARPWFVVNVDRGLPFAEGSLAATVHLNSRVPVDEVARVLRPDGRAFVVLADDDDLDGLRRVALGDDRPTGRVAAWTQALAGRWTCDDELRVATSVTLDLPAAEDALRATWRAREANLARLREAGTVTTTLSWRILVYRVPPIALGSPARGGIGALPAGSA